MAVAPYTMSEHFNSYSLFLILSQSSQKRTLVSTDRFKRELTIKVAKKSNRSEKLDYWIFEVPEDGLMSEIQSQFRQSGIEITIPKKIKSIAAS